MPSYEAHRPCCCHAVRSNILQRPYATIGLTLVECVAEAACEACATTPKENCTFCRRSVGAKRCNCGSITFEGKQHDCFVPSFSLDEERWPSGCIPTGAVQHCARDDGSNRCRRRGRVPWFRRSASLTPASCRENQQHTAHVRSSFEVEKHHAR